MQMQYKQNSVCGSKSKNVCKLYYSNQWQTGVCLIFHVGRDPEKVAGWGGGGGGGSGSSDTFSLPVFFKFSIWGTGLPPTSPTCLTYKQTNTHTQNILSKGGGGV